MARDLQEQPGGLKRALQERERLLVENAEWIAGRVATLLDHYYQPDQDDRILAASTADWIEILGGFPRDVIQTACRRYIRDEPRRRPTPGAIYEIAREVMPKPKPVERPREPEPWTRREPSVSAEARRQIVEDAGIESPMLRKVLRGDAE